MTEIYATPAAEPSQSIYADRVGADAEYAVGGEVGIVLYTIPPELEKKMGIRRVPETSRRAPTRAWFRMPGLLIVLWFADLLGVIRFIGRIWTLPLWLLTLARVNQKIFGVEAHRLAE